MEKFYAEMEIRKGYNTSVPGAETFNFIKDFGVLKLDAGSSFEETCPDCETAIVILQGSCSIAAGDRVFGNISGRESVFGGMTSSVYIPPGMRYSVVSDEGIEAGICKAACMPYGGEAKLITPDDVKVMQVGRDNWAREVRIMIGPHIGAKNIIIGETINPPGNWSGTPPHKHENNNLPKESRHEELYYFRTDKPQGWGIERLYSPERNINELIYLQNNTVTFMPWGYHQIVAAPGYTLYYLFFLAGEDNVLSGLEDSNHNWIKNT